MTAELTPCRTWRGARDGNGYGMVWREGRSIRTHRWVWILANGPIPSGMFILHHCDNPPCFRLDHLYAGTQAQNMADRDSRGRGPQGERHGAAKLTAEQVRDIRSRTGQTQLSIAIEFGVTRSAIQQILSGSTWAIPQDTANRGEEVNQHA